MEDEEDDEEEGDHGLIMPEILAFIRDQCH